MRQDINGEQDCEDKLRVVDDSVVTLVFRQERLLERQNNGVHNDDDKEKPIEIFVLCDQEK